MEKGKSSQNFNKIKIAGLEINIRGKEEGKCLTTFRVRR